MISTESANLEQPNVKTAAAEVIVTYCEWRGQSYSESDLATQNAAEAGALRAYVGFLCDERDRLLMELARAQDALTGKGQAYSGCRVISLSFGDSECLVAYDFQPEEPMVRYYPDGSGYPGCAASVDICDVWVNGGWLGDASLIDSSVRDKWEQQIIDHEAEQASEDRA